MRMLGIVLFFLSIPVWAAGEMPVSFTMSGKLFESPTTTEPLLEQNIELRIQILNSTKTCVLYDEKQLINTDTTDGGFSVQVGSLIGAGKRVTGSDRGNAMTTIFQNTMAIPGTCSGAPASSAPVNNGGRYLRVIVKPQGDPEDVLSPDIFIGHVQMALVAETLGGLTKDQFLQLGTGTSELTQTNLETIFSATNFPILEGLVEGTATTGGISSDGNYVITANADNTGTGVIQLSIGTSVAAEITNSGNFIANQRIGIGTGVPSFDLSFGGTSDRTIGLERNSSGSGSDFIIASGGAAAGALNSPGGDLVLASGLSTGSAGSKIIFQTPTPGGVDNSPVTKMILDTLGRLGINNTSPDRPLHISSNTGPTILLDYVTAGTDQKRRFITNTADGALSFGKFSDDMNANTEHLRILSSGNIGVGTLAPASRFHLAVAPSASSSYGLLSLGSAPFDGTTADFFTGHSAGTLIAGNLPNSYTGDLINLQIGGVTKFKVDGSGAVTSGGPLTTTGNISQSGASTLSTGTGGVTINGATTIAANQNLSMASGSGTFTQNYTGTGSPTSITASSMASGNVMSLTSASSAVTGNQSGLSVLLSGANAAGGVTRYGLFSSVASTGSTSTNVGGYFSASGATNNYGLIVNGGNVGIGTTSPSTILQIEGPATTYRTGLKVDTSSNTYGPVLSGYTTRDSAERIFFSGNLIARDDQQILFGNASNYALKFVSGTQQLTISDGSNTFVGVKKNTTTADFSINASHLFVRNDGNIGVGTNSPTSIFDVSGGNIAAVFGADNGATTRTNLNGKVARLGFAPVTNSDLPISFLFGQSTPTGGSVAIGGGSVMMNAANSIDFYTASTKVPTGTSRMTIDSSGRVGIGITSPVQPLDVNGNARISGTLYINAMSRGSSSNSLNLYSDIASGSGGEIIANGSTKSTDPGIVLFKTGEGANSERVRIDSSGNVGIGTTAPGVLLDVNGTVRSASLLVNRVTRASSADSLSLYSDPVATSGGQIDLYGSTNASRAGVITFKTAAGANSERMRIDASGNVGIGTTSPGAKLDIVGPSVTSFTGTSLLGVVTRVVGTANHSGIDFMNDGRSTTNPLARIAMITTAFGSNLKFGTTNDWAAGGISNTAMTIDHAGNLGVGATPTARLHIIGSGAASFPATSGSVQSANSVRVQSANSTSTLDFGGNSGSGNWLQSTNVLDLSVNYPLLLNPNGGNIGIGTTNPGMKLDVNGDIRIAAASKLYIGTVAVCDSTGCPSPSDRRYKENIAPLKNSLENILRIKGVGYDWVDKQAFNDKHQIGFIAQDLEKIYPEVVKTDERTGLKSVMYDHLIAPMIEAFKTLYIRVQNIENENKKLKKENAAIIAYLCAKDKNAPMCFD